MYVRTYVCMYVYIDKAFVVNFGVCEREMSTYNGVIIVCIKWTNERSRSNEQTNQSANQQAQSYISVLTHTFTRIYKHICTHARTHTHIHRILKYVSECKLENEWTQQRRHELSETPYNNEKEDEE